MPVSPIQAITRRTARSFAALVLLAASMHTANAGIADEQYLAKGGIGIASQNVYVVVKSEFNEIVLPSDRWSGSSRSTPEVVYVQDSKAYRSASDVPAFELSKCTLIAFQPDRIYVYDFSLGEGGYYLRHAP
jgi:hypothetical protein